MNEGSKPYFDTNEEENIIDAEEIPEFEGICSKCFGSTYVMRERNGVLGVLFTSTSQDSEGKPVKKLVSCDCNVEVTF